MSPKNYDITAKREAVELVTKKGHTMAQAAHLTGVSLKTLYAWRKEFAPIQTEKLRKKSGEVKSLKRKLQDLKLERDILLTVFNGLDIEPSKILNIIDMNEHIFPTEKMCKILNVRTDQLEHFQNTREPHTNRDTKSKPKTHESIQKPFKSQRKLRAKPTVRFITELPKRSE